MIEPTELTAEMVRDVRSNALSTKGFELGYSLASHCDVWLRWNADGRDRNEYNARRAARIITDHINSAPRKP